MKAFSAFGASFSVTAFYRITWQLLILLTAILAVGSQVVRPWVGVPAFLVAYLLMTRLGFALASRQRLLTIIASPFLLALAAEELLRVHRLEDFIQAMIEMICCALSLLLMRQGQTRTYWLAVLNVVIIGVGSISLTSSPLIYSVFLLQTGFVLLNMNAAHLYLGDEAERQNEKLPQGYLTQFFLVMPLGMVSALLIFLLFPRVQSLTMALTHNFAGHRVGYSGQINLSGGGELQESQSLAFMVEADDREWLETSANALLFRGDALDAFDGRHWTSTAFSSHTTQMADLRLATQHSRDIHLLTMHLEPSPQATLFYPEILLSVTPRAPGNMHVVANSNGSISRDNFTMERVTYETRVVSPEDDDLPTEPAATFKAAIEAPADKDQGRSGQWSAGGAQAPSTLPPRDLATLLAIPDAVREAPYFQAWLKEVNINPQRSGLRAIERRLTRIFASKFTTTLGNSFEGDEPLAAFLGSQREGHCEYFATSTVLTLRALGVPARVVVGYFGGTFNDLVGALEVRDADAHAWVEAFVPGFGWHTFNPTPASPREASSGLLSMARIYANAISFWLRLYVVDYDQSTQRSLWTSLQGMVPKPEPHADNRFPWLQQYGRPCGLALCLAVLFWWLSQLWRSQATTLKLPRYYKRFLGQQRRAGRPRLLGETFAAYHSRLRPLLAPAELPQLNQLDQRLHDDLYGRHKTAR